MNCRLRAAGHSACLKGMFIVGTVTMQDLTLAANIAADRLNTRDRREFSMDKWKFELYMSQLAK